MKNLTSPEIWFVCGSQHLYGPGPLKQVAANAQTVATALGAAKRLPLKTVFNGRRLAAPRAVATVCALAATCLSGPGP